MTLTRKFFFSQARSDITRNSKDKLYIEDRRLNIRKYFFTNRVAPLWNKLPSNIKNAPSTNHFKDQIDNWKVYKDMFYCYDA